MNSTLLFSSAQSVKLIIKVAMMGNRLMTIKPMSIGEMKVYPHNGSLPYSFDLLLIYRSPPFYV